MLHEDFCFDCKEQTDPLVMCDFKVIYFSQKCYIIVNNTWCCRTAQDVFALIACKYNECPPEYGTARGTFVTLKNAGKKAK